MPKLVYLVYACGIAFLASIFAEFAMLFSAGVLSVIDHQVYRAAIDELLGLQWIVFSISLASFSLMTIVLIYVLEE